MTTPVNNADIYILTRNNFNHFPDDFSESIRTAFKDNIYQHVFIPLCFGSSLSDYNGLRLATHIRCTEGLNQTSTIYIYGVVDFAHLVTTPFFDILKTKNVFYISMSKKEFERIANMEKEALKKEELPHEISKLNLKAPSNYDDNHAITNEIAIYQWSKMLGIDENEELQKNFDIIKNNLYFKYLNTINPIKSRDNLVANDLRIITNAKPKILLIDDESSKGWYEIFASILGDFNGFWVDYLGDGFRNKIDEEIVEESIEKIKKEDIDVVIIDFRLNTSDFVKENPDEMSSVKLIKKIKEYNPGVQVIGFSATNKIWNYEILKEAGVDFFVLKRSQGENPKEIVCNFISNLNGCIKKGFLKEFFKEQIVVSKELLPRKNVKHLNPLPKEFVSETLKWLSLSNEILLKGNLDETSIVSSYLFKFIILENISNRIINIEKPITEINSEGKTIYKYEFRANYERLKNFIEDENKDGNYRKTKSIFKSIKRPLPWHIKILNAIDYASEFKLNSDKLSEIINKRNTIIHANSTTGESISISISNLRFLNEIVINGLRNIS